MRNIKIVSNKPCDNGLVKTQGTRVYADDTELKGVAGITVHYAPDDIVRATMDVHVWQDEVNAGGDFFMVHPVTGESIEIKRIEFADGSTFECGAIDVTSLSSTAKTLERKHWSAPFKRK